jgi:uncharacterized membrane protein YgdD (TMEM256/DUF423 family)
MNKTYLTTGALFICLSILLGAFGAHGLKEVLTSEELSSFEVGVKYQMYHGLAFLAIGFNSNKFQFLKICCIGFIVGIVLFSGSIYLLSIDSIFGIKMSFLGPVTPIGGAILIITWSYFILKVFKEKFNE